MKYSVAAVPVLPIPERLKKNEKAIIITANNADNNTGIYAAQSICELADQLLDRAIETHGFSRPNSLLSQDYELRRKAAQLFLRDF